MVKRCTGCHEEKAEASFYGRTASPDGLAFRCIACVQAYAKANANRTRETKRRWHQEHAEQTAANKRAWRKANPDMVKAEKRRSYVKNPEPTKRRMRAWKLAHPKRTKEYHREYTLKKYGLTVETYRKLEEGQRGRCACCGKEKRLCVDHCHRSGKVRALLCHSCNLAIGLMQDNPNTFESAAQYLRKHSPFRFKGITRVLTVFPGNRNIEEEA